MTCHTPQPALSAAPQMPFTDIAAPACFPSFPMASADRSTSAPNTARTPKRGGGVQTMVSRELLAAEAKRLRDLRQSKASSRCEAELRRVTHEILSQGGQQHVG